MSPLPLLISLSLYIYLRPPPLPGEYLPLHDFLTRLREAGAPVVDLLVLSATLGRPDGTVEVRALPYLYM